MINKKSIKNLILADINMPLILFEDTANIDSVESEYTNEYKFFDDEAKKFIDENFEREFTLNNKIFNGTMYGLTNFEMYDGKIFVSYEKDDFKTFLATKNPEYKQYILNKNFFILPISVSNVIITKDNKIIAGSKNKFCNYNKLVGGFISTVDIINEKINILHCSLRECEEKIGDLKLYNYKIIGVYKTNQCSFVVYSETDYTSEEIKKIYANNKNEDNYEMSNMFFIDNNEQSIGNIILNSGFKDDKISFKFHLKENFNNYDYINTKL